MVIACLAGVTNRKRFRAQRGEAAYILLDLTGGPQQSSPGQHQEG